MVKIVSFGFAVVATATGLMSAWYWLRSNQINAVSSWAQNGGLEPVIPEISTLGWISGLLEAGQKSGELNKKAAYYTAVAVALGALSNFVASWPG
jgi:hypothetical protein